MIAVRSRSHFKRVGSVLCDAVIRHDQFPVLIFDLVGCTNLGIGAGRDSRLPALYGTLGSPLWNSYYSPVRDQFPWVRFAYDLAKSMSGTRSCSSAACRALM
jgi:hypothetical protein